MHSITKEKIYRIPIPTPFLIGDTNVYLIVGEMLTLIDAGVKTDEAWNTLNSQLSKLGFDFRDIEQIVLTHHHPDHTGLINQFPNVVRILGHQNCIPWLKHDKDYLHDYSQFLTLYYTKHGVPCLWQTKNVVFGS